MEKVAKAKVTIIGAGPVGLASAHYLRASGMKAADIILVDRHKVAERTAAIPAPGNIAPDLDSTLGKNSDFDSRSGYMRSRQLYEELPDSAKAKIELVPNRIVELVGSQFTLDDLTKRYSAHGFSYEVLTPAQLHELEPSISTDACFAALLLGGEINGHVNPVKLVNYLAEDSIANGTRIVQDANITGIARNGDGFVVNTNAGVSIDTEYVVNAAGISIPKVSALLDPKYGDIGIIGVKGHGVRFAPLPGLNLGIDLLTKSGSIVQYNSGEIIIGGGQTNLLRRENHKWSENWDVEQKDVDTLIDEARTTLPALKSAKVRSVTIGFRAVTFTQQAIIGRLDRSNFILAGGLYRTGITNCLGAGEQVAEIVRGERPGRAITGDPMRFYVNRPDWVEPSFMHL